MLYTLDGLFRAVAERRQQPPKAAVLLVVAMKGTRLDPHFPPTHPEIKKEYLRSYDGERKAEREAEAIVIDVSKFMKYASPGKVNWLHVTEPLKVREYLEDLRNRVHVEWMAG